MGTLPAHVFFGVGQASAIQVSNVGSPSNEVSSTIANLQIDYMHSCMYIYGGTPLGYVEFDVSSSALSSGWCRFVMDSVLSSQVTTTGYFSMFGGTTELFRLRQVNTSAHWIAEYWDGAAWASVGSTITSPLASVANRYDIRFNLANSGGEFTIYVNGLEVATFSGDTLTTADTTISKIRFTSPSTSGVIGQTQSIVWGGIVFDSADTRNIVFDETIANATGAETGWTNDEPAIDDRYGSPNIADFIVGSADGQTETFVFNPAQGAVAGNNVDGVYLVISARAQTTPGLHIRGISRISGVNYESDNAVQPPSDAWREFILEFDLNPATAAEWVNPAAVDAAQWGVRVKATP